MGFDDSLFDGDVVEKVFAALKSKGSLTYYVLDKFEPAMTKEALERCEEESVQYHGYSLAYHMILPLMKVFDLGLSPVGSSTNLIGDCGFARLKTRELGADASAQLVRSGHSLRARGHSRTLLSRERA
ncbi:hypothetical protein NFJ02_04g117480 [Pycnococcus provasolii]